mmetsp:Transcript_33298/g.89128  ORF Transcript_33298/g.89128 Transcript_33298/m.89128 type:complete len:216 (+) Transcript_33298:578-1225(+)
MRLHPESQPDWVTRPRGRVSLLCRPPGTLERRAAQLRFFSGSAKHLMLLNLSILYFRSKATSFRMSISGMFNRTSGSSDSTTLSSAPRDTGRGPGEPRSMDPHSGALFSGGRRIEAFLGKEGDGVTTSPSWPPSLPTGGSWCLRVLPIMFFISFSTTNQGFASSSAESMKCPHRAESRAGFHLFPRCGPVSISGLSAVAAKLCVQPKSENVLLNV